MGSSTSRARSAPAAATAGLLSNAEPNAASTDEHIRSDEALACALAQQEQEDAALAQRMTLGGEPGSGQVQMICGACGSTTRVLVERSTPGTSIRAQCPQCTAANVFRVPSPGQAGRYVTMVCSVCSSSVHVLVPPGTRPGQEVRAPCTRCDTTLAFPAPAL
mmetsp:Transcript_85528/g.250399  ORF Transcript_85528/g.250399 Transcript_85528/m.250399 type:complete len:162 (-) Transcript_85528:69-554(-)